MEADMSAAAIAIVCSYVIGSFPTAYIVARLRKGIDIRDVGSRNMGAMNVVYQVGLPEGVLVLAVDIAKGAAAILLARWLGASLAAQLAAGAAAVVGHAFPLFLKFRGGKGGAACIGVLAVLLPWGIPWYLGVFIASLLITRYPTLSYGVAFLSVPFIAWLIYDSRTLVVYSLALLVILVFRYVPRLKEMYSAAGGWRRVFLRSSLKDRL